MIPQFSQLFIYSPDKNNSTCKIFIATPSLDKEQTLGRLFGIIEIESPDRALWDTVSHLAEEMEKYYYGESNIQLTLGRPNRAISVEETFEKSIQVFNDRLIELIKGGKLANLLQKINIILGVFKDETVHFAAVGNASAFLIHQLKSQEYRLVNILDTAGGREEKINPFKILSHIVNGQINKNDSLLFCTNSLLDYLSLDKIKQTLTTLEPAAATRHLKDLLLEASINTTFSSIIIKLNPGPAEVRGESEIRLPQKSLEHLVVTEKTTEEYLSPPLKFNVKKYSAWLVAKTKTTAQTAYRGYQAYQQKKRADQKRSELSRLADQASGLVARKPQIQPAKEPARIKTPANKIQPLAAAKLEGQKILLRGIAGVRSVKAAGLGFQRGLINQKRRWRENGKIIYSRSLTLLARGINRVKAWPRQSQILVVACLILFIILAESLVWLGQNRLSGEEQKTYNRLTAEIQQKYSEAESALIYNDTARAGQLLAAAKVLDSQFTPAAKRQKNTATLEAQLLALDNKLQRRVTVTPQLLADLPQAIGQPFTANSLNLIDQKLYTINDLTGAFYRLDLADKKVTPLNLISTNPQIKFSFINQKTITYYHGGNGLVRLDPAANSLTEAPINLAGQENKINDLAIYNNRLYILNSAASQIYRYQPAGSGFGAASPWVRDDSDLKTATAIAADGDVYLLTNTAEIKKMSSGKNRDWQYDTVEPSLATATKIWTNAATDYLYILDPQNRRLVVINKTNGRLAAQYSADSFGQLKDFAINEKNKAAYLLSGNLIYQIDLQ
ncbi:MAG: hypothetical protein WCT37_00745 [Patescibacteria group bacterium]|jgi:hypothetical protein